jgi:NAD(P)H-hydrate epimerase
VKQYRLAQAYKDLPKRNSTANKTAGGKCLVIAGSQGMWGAATLTASAAARSGAGYVYLSLQTNFFPVHKNPDFLETNIKKYSKINFKAFAVGPGLSKNQWIMTWIKELIRHKKESVVLDAAALNAVAKSSKKIKLPATWIMTPHEGELARLIHVSSKKIKADRAKYLLIAQEKFGCLILLKGHQTLIADGAAIYRIQSGNAALAKAGTGDVLTGMILAFLSQGLSPVKAASLAAFVHGKIADDWLKAKKDILSLRATDLIEQLPTTLFKIRK